MNMNIKEILNKTFNLGQTYWQQADSEYLSQNKKADSTLSKFQELSLAVEIDVNQAKIQMDYLELQRNALLEALEALVECPELEYSYTHSYVIKARAAIAAAKGEV
jgi:hypothetical protein